MDINKLKLSYVASDNLYDWVKTEFDSYTLWTSFEQEKTELIASWEDERNFRIVEAAKQGLIKEVTKGNATAVAQLKGLLGLQLIVLFRFMVGLDLQAKHL